MNNNPLVSVITTTYNRAHLLPRAIRSVLNQTYQNFELIIVDDASTDNTKEVVKSFEDGRIIYYKHKENRGVLAAKNTGFDLAKGEYYVGLDDDDELLPEALETAVNKLIELSPQGVKCVVFAVTYVETGRFSSSYIRKEGYMDYEDLLRGRRRPGLFRVMHKDWIGDNRYDERLWGGEIILTLRLQRKSAAYYVPKVLQRKYREHGDNISDPINLLKQIPRHILTQKAFLEEYGDELRHFWPQSYGQRLVELGTWQIFNGDMSTGRKTLRESFKYRFSSESRILYLLSFMLNKNQIISLYAVYIRFLNIIRVAASPLIAFRKLLSRTEAS